MPRFVVINAFRHQRFLHVGDKMPNAVDEVVINAFRHQRFLHRAIRERNRVLVACDQRLSASKIFAHRCEISDAAPGRRDQRLSASKIFALFVILVY